MAKIIEDAVVIKFSRIVKDSESEVSDIATDDIQAALEQVSHELVGDGVVVEIVRV